MKNYKLEPYEEILSEWFRLNKQMRCIIGLVAIYFLVFLVGLAFSVSDHCNFLVKPTHLLIGSSFIATGTWIYAMWQYHRISIIESKRYREIENAITPELESMAREWYGKDWHKALRECIEAHFPGDCPLCGAE